MVQTRSQTGTTSPSQKIASESQNAPPAAEKQKKSTSPKMTTITTKKDAKETKPKAKPSSESNIIVINRAPVLHLWASCVTHKLHPDEPWPTCLSSGTAIAALCAVAKGRSIGVMPPRDADEQEDNKALRAKNKERDRFHELEVMHFKFRVKDGNAYIGDKAQLPGEEALVKKFGGAGSYDLVKKTFEHALATWQGDAGKELNGAAFSMYEKFRPSVSGGQKGWGRMGELSLETITRVVSTKS